MPNCPCCKTNHRVSPRGFHQRHFGRLIIGQQDNYYIIGRSYYCKKCQEDNEQSKISFERQAAKLKAQAEELGIEAESPSGVTPDLAKAGDGCVVVQFDRILSPGLKLPRYKHDGESATLSHFQGARAVVPVRMLRTYT